MTSKTKGIVLHYIKYQESSIIVRIFTEEYGLVSFIVNGIRSSKSKRSIGYFQTFSLLDLVVYMKEGREIQRLSEYKFLVSTPRLFQDIRKSTIIMFLSEFLGKALHQEHGNQHQLFDFLFQMTLLLENMTVGIENFHLHFLIRLSSHIGIEIKDGEMLVHSMDRDLSEKEKTAINLITLIAKSDVDEIIDCSGTDRLNTLKLIIEYYQHHGAQIGEIKSLKVLHQVFS